MIDKDSQSDNDNFLVRNIRDHHVISREVNGFIKFLLNAYYSCEKDDEDTMNLEFSKESLLHLALSLKQMSNSLRVEKPIN